MTEKGGSVENHQNDHDDSNLINQDRVDDTSLHNIRSPSPTTTAMEAYTNRATQKRFHLLCLQIKKELYEQDPTHNINFQLSISELFEIANYLDVNEDNWETFCRVQLLNGTPAAMIWVAALVASMQNKDVEIDSMKERISWLEREVGDLRTHRRCTGKQRIASSPTRRTVPLPVRKKRAADKKKATPPSPPVAKQKKATPPSPPPPAGVKVNLIATIPPLPKKTTDHPILDKYFQSINDEN